MPVTATQSTGARPEIRVEERTLGMTIQGGKNAPQAAPHAMTKDQFIKSQVNPVNPLKDAPRVPQGNPLWASKK